MKMINLKYLFIMILVFISGFVVGTRHKADLSPNLIGESGWLFGWKVVDLRDPWIETRIVCTQPYVSQSRRIIECTPREAEETQ